MGVVTDKNLELFADELIPSIVRQMTKAELDALSESAKRGLIYTTDEDENVSASGASVVYSTEERIVGIWHDGRPIYQQTHILEGNAKQGSDFIGIFDYPTRTILIDSEGFFWRYWNNEPQYESYMFAIPYLQMDNAGKTAISISVGSSYLNTKFNVWLATYFDLACPYKAEVTLRYVKPKEGGLV